MTRSKVKVIGDDKVNNMLFLVVDHQNHILVLMVYNQEKLLFWMIIITGSGGPLNHVNNLIPKFLSVHQKCFLLANWTQGKKTPFVVQNTNPAYQLIYTFQGFLQLH